MNMTIQWEMEPSGVVHFLGTIGELGAWYDFMMDNNYPGWSTLDKSRPVNEYE